MLLSHSEMMTNGFPMWLFRWLARYAYQSSDRIAVVTNNFVTDIRAKRVPDDKLRVIRNWLHTDEVRPLQRNDSIRLENGIRSRHLRCHLCGKHEPFTGLEVVLHAANRLRLSRARCSHKRAVFRNTNRDEIGSSPYRRLSSPTTKTRVDVNPRSQIPAIMASRQLMFAGLHPAGDAAALVHDLDWGLLIESGKANQLAQAICQIRSAKALRERYAANGRGYAVRNFSRGVAIDAYEQVLKEAVAIRDHQS
jgi:colanic acid biosynthesis glycosyl transferase WcaI